MMVKLPIEILEQELEKYESAWRHNEKDKVSEEDYELHKKNLSKIIPQYKRAILILIKSEDSMEDRQLKIERFHYYNGIIKYHRIDDLKPKTLPNGSEVHLEAVWIADIDERFAGQMIFLPAEGCYLLPECDLIIKGEIMFDEYKKHRNILETNKNNG